MEMAIKEELNQEAGNIINKILHINFKKVLIPDKKISVKKTENYSIRRNKEWKMKIKREHNLYC